MIDKINNLTLTNSAPHFEKFLYLFWVFIFLGSRDFLGMGNTIGYPDIIQEAVNQNSLTNLIILIFSISLFVKYKSHYHVDHFGIMFIILNLFIFFLILINPNNNFTSIKDVLLGYDQKCFYTFIVFFVALFFLPPNLIYEVVKHIFIAGVKIGLVITISALLYYFFGPGFVLFGQKSTIVHADVLQTLSILAIILSVIFFLRREKINLLYVALIMLTIFLSFRRSSFWFFFITMFLITFSFLKHGFISKRALSLFIFLFIVFIVTLIKWGNDFFDVEYYLQRQMAAFSFFSGQDFSGGNIYLTDSNHLEQSIETSKFIKEFILNRFWGNGIGSSFMESTNNVRGASMGGIHNSFAFVVIRYGTFMFLYVLIILYVLAKTLIKRVKIFKVNSSIQILLSYVGVLILFLSLLSSWSPTMVTFVFADTTSIVQFVTMFSLIKVVNSHDKSKNIDSLT